MSEIPPPRVPPTAPPPSGGSYTPPPSSPQDSERTVMLVLAYLGLLALIPLLTRKDDREVQWHAKNGLVIFVAEIVVVIVLSVIGNVPGMGCLNSILMCILPLGFLAIAIFGIVKATQGQRFRIPFVSDFADKF